MFEGRRVPAAGGGRDAPASTADLARVRVDIASRVADATRLADLGELAGEMADISGPLEDVLVTVVDLLHGDAGALLLRNPVTGMQAVVVTRGVAPAAVDAPGGDAATPEGFAASTELPMVTLAGDTMGCIRVFRREGDEPQASTLELAAGFARQGAEMIERARLHGEAQALAVRQQQHIAQVRDLAATAVRLSAARDVEEILRLVTESACAIIGTHQGVSSRLQHGWAEALTHVVLSDKYAEWRTYDRVPQGLGVLNYVTRENQPLRLTGAELARHPEWRGLRDAPDHPPLPNYLAAPLVGRDGRNLGLVQLADKVDGSEFTEENEAMLVQLAQLASASIENVELFRLERQWRERAERSERRQRLLSHASHAFAMSLDLQQTVSTVTRTVVPEFADWCGIHLVGADGRLRLEGSASHQADVGERIEALVRKRDPDVQLPAGSSAVARTGRSELYPDVSDDLLRSMATADMPYESLKALGIRSALVAPLPGRGSTIGALTLVRLGGEAYGAEDLEFAEDLARRAALALENATRFELERQAADMLQRTLLPQSLPRSARLACAARYRAGAAGSRVGGDWYDVIELDARHVVLIVGDVMGHGVKAAMTMGQLRSAVLAFASEGHRPAQLLARLDSLVRRMGDAHFATCLCVLLDLDTGLITVATAGHPPPLLVTATGAAAFVDAEPGLPLGLDVAPPDYTQHEGHLPVGAMLVLYTDGLVESRTEPLASGMRRLQTEAGCPWDDPEALCDHVLEHVGDGGRSDDLAVLVVQRPGDRTGDRQPAASRSAGESAEEAVSLLLDRRSPGRARAFVREHLRRWRREDIEDVAVLLTSEVVTNAQLHGREPLQVRIADRGMRVRVEVSDGSAEVPVVRDYGVEAGTGRGLHIVEQLAAAWGVDVRAGGKTVWFEVS